MTESGLRGGLVSASFANDVLPVLSGVTPVPPAVQRALERWSERHLASFGPASGVRSLADGVVVPLLRLLGLEPATRSEEFDRIRLGVRIAGAWLPVLVLPWGGDLSKARRAAVLAAIERDSRWCVYTNGVGLRISDARRTWSRAHVEFDLELLAQSSTAQLLLWNVLSAEAWTSTPPRLDAIADSAALYIANVCRALGKGVLGCLGLLVNALGRHPHTERHRNDVYEQALTVVYRMLFLLFAEARGLVPMWHPIYRDRYTIDSIVSALLSGRRPRGLWAAVQAISRLAHAGCRAGTLKVTAFNGRLFSPAHAAAFERRPLDDRIMAAAVLAVSTTAGRGGTSRISFGDLDVEQLGSVYEQVLEYRPAPAGGQALARDREARKATGTFYTPRHVTAYVVEQTLAPLVADRSASQILSLRILDPAMGSGAFLVAACRFLARAAEDALIADGTWHPGDVTAPDRAELRRTIAQRCLYGVDLNPVAVQLARLSLWLTTLAAEKPLTFLDHHLVAGNSLIGATPEDVARQPGAQRGGGRVAPLPLFGDIGWVPVLDRAAAARQALAMRPDDSAAVVKEKERTLAAVHASGTVLGRWAQLLDLWCSGWFQPHASRIPRALFGDLADLIVRGTSALAPSQTEPLLAQASATARRHGFLHWPLAFPEVFTGNSSGFDVVVGNPPWDMVRGDSGGSETREERREIATYLTGFVREAGVYRLQTQGHLNRYALFTERALQLLRPGGRVGLVLPGGIATDVGAASLRRHLFDHTRVEAITGLDNRNGIFPIHRSVRFVLLTATAGSATNAVTCRFGISDPTELDRNDDVSPPLRLARSLIARISGPDDLGIPDLRTAEDLEIVESMTARLPCLGEPGGWGIRFGRELNATDDRHAFVPVAEARGARRILEGKQLGPFRVDLDRSVYAIPSDLCRRVPRRARLAYREVAAATNRLTLMAAIVPADAVTTHTLFCLKTSLPADTQRVICALMNSFVANYLVRLRVNTHVTAALLARLRMPVVPRGSSTFVRLSHLALALATGAQPVDQMEEYVELQALAARLYGLTPSTFAHVLSRFPLIPSALRNASLRRLETLNEQRGMWT